MYMLEMNIDAFKYQYINFPSIDLNDSDLFKPIQLECSCHAFQNQKRI